MMAGRFKILSFLVIAATISQIHADGVRLVHGPNQYSGTVEVYYRGQWGTICDDSFDLNDAMVICRMLNMRVGTRVYSNAHFGEGSGNITIDELDCIGNETDISQCHSNPWFTHDCSHGEDAGVECRGNISLVDGPNAYSGRVEVYHGGSWGTICDDSFDLNDAIVICRMLNLYDMNRTPILYPNAHFGEGSGNIAIDELDCIGNETDISQCHSNPWFTHDCSHGEDVGINCRANVRLVNGPNRQSGTVEVFYRGQWGTICDDSFDVKDAIVICRMLNLYDGRSHPIAYQSAHFGQGSGSITIDDLNCKGTELDLSNCSSRQWLTHDCSHSEDAGVECRFENWVRLSAYSHGFVEMFINGSRGSICDESFTKKDAEVICRSAGFPNVTSYSTVNGSWSPVLTNLRCNGAESNISFCSYSINKNKKVCPTPQVQCENKIRLVNGPDKFSGRVEIYYKGQWGTICDNYFDKNDAKVICRMLQLNDGFSHDKAFWDASFGQGSGNTTIDQLRCTGDEEELSECQSLPWLSTNCGHNNDAGVQCRASNVQLANRSHGLVEAYINGSRGFICDDSFSYKEAQVICRSLEFPGVQSYFTVSGSGPVSVTKLNCSGGEQDINNCSYLPYNGNRTCRMAHVHCDNNIRLVNGSDQYTGRVEVFYKGQWGTICGYNFDQNDAKVICRILQVYDGYSDVKAYKEAYFGQGNVNISIDNLGCSGSEEYLFDCQSRPWLRSNCQYQQAAGVDCRVSSARLSSWINGTVNVYINDRRGSICDDSFSNEDAKVICRSLGFPGVQSHYTVNGSGPVVVTNLNCNGSERDIIFCQHTSYQGNRVCPRAYVQCENKIRLVNSPNQHSGTVEIFYKGQWGTICDGNFDNNDAVVLCGMLQMNDSLSRVRAYSNAYFGQGRGNTIIDGLGCGGYEQEVSVCTSTPWLSHNCSHSDDAGIDCGGSVVHLSGFDGLVEVNINGRRGSVCDDAFIHGDAEVICQSLGFPGVDNYYTVEGSGPVAMTNLNCFGGESDISHCTYDLHRGNLNCRRAHVHCKDKVRLINGSNEYSGRVEVYFKGKWGTVCDDSFDVNDASVICRMLHMFHGQSVTQAYSNAYFGQGTGNITIDDLNCRGFETDLVECQSLPWFTHNCGHNEDAGVDCGASLPSGSTMYPPTHTTYHRQTTTQSVSNIIYVSCNENGWQIDLDFYKLRQMYPSAVASDIYLGENSCTGTEYYGALRFRQGFSECLTNEILRNSVLVYTNELIYAQHDRHNPFIIKSINWTVPVECDVDKNGSSDGLFHHIDHSVTAKPAEVGHSKYSIKIAFYDDPNFAHEIEGNPLQIQLGSKVYVKVFTLAADWDVKMRVHTCFTKPTADAPNQMRYDIIKNGCEVDANTHLLLQYAHETRLVFQDFQYTTNHDTIYLHCDANFCNTNDFSPECSQTCQTS